jgi:hypothetical protein
MAGLMDYLTPGQPESYITNLDPEFAGQLQRFVSARPGISIYSGARSIERQQQLWDAKLKETGGDVAAARKWVAPPGKSKHNHGLAGDLRYADDAARQWAHANAGAYGLNFPMKHEPWHIEPIGARASSAPGNAPVQPAGDATGNLASHPAAPSPAGWQDYMPQDPNPIAQQGFRNFAQGYSGRDLMEDVITGQNPLRRLMVQKLEGLFT